MSQGRQARRLGPALPVLGVVDFLTGNFQVRFPTGQALTLETQVRFLAKEERNAVISPQIISPVYFLSGDSSFLCYLCSWELVKLPQPHLEI